VEADLQQVLHEFLLLVERGHSGPLAR
jgi:hypothetical protein